MLRGLAAGLLALQNSRLVQNLFTGAQRARTFGMFATTVFQPAADRAAGRDGNRDRRDGRPARLGLRAGIGPAGSGVEQVRATRTARFPPHDQPLNPPAPHLEVAAQAMRGR